jgi:predicted RNA-binding protein with PUA-like domain
MSMLVSRVTGCPLTYDCWNRPPQPKKATKATTKASKTSKAAEKTEETEAIETSSSVLTKTAPPTASSETNRDADGNQEVYWLLKAEPLPRLENGVNVAFSIDDLEKCASPEPWNGVRNPQARNNMQAMRVGDLGFFYHSNAKPPGVAGILRIVKEAEVDESAFDSKDPYYDAKSDKAKPKWYCVSVEFVKKFDEVVDLAKIKSHAEKGAALEKMQLVTNSRLSVSRVSKSEWEFIMGLAEGKEEEQANGDEEVGEVGAAEE